MPEGRDLTLDLARVACVVLVVFIHVLFVGVSRAPDGSLVIARPVEGLPWFDAASWIANIMPLFFVVGGYASRVGWRSTLARGGDADSFVRVRIARLARPALPVFVFFTLALGLSLLFLNLDGAFVDTISIGIGSPLWFLGAYMVVQALAPHMITLHERWGWRVPAVLLAGALLVDAFRFIVGRGVWGLDRIDLSTFRFGEEFLGVPNVLFVWLFCQQVGFWMADGWFHRRSPQQLFGLIFGGYAAAYALVSLGGYSWSMLGNQWPPTVPLALLAIVQASALTLLRHPLTALMAKRWMRGIVFLLGSRLMTIYLWHLPLVMLLTGIQILLPFPLPTPGMAVWWWTRVLFTIVVLAAAWALSLWLGRYEKPFPNGPSRLTAHWGTTVAVIVFVLPTIAIAAYGLDLTLAIAGLIGTLVALTIVAPRRVREPRPATSTV